MKKKQMKKKQMKKKQQMQKQKKKKRIHDNLKESVVVEKNQKH